MKPVGIVSCTQLCDCHLPSLQCALCLNMEASLPENGPKCLLQKQKCEPSGLAL